MSILASLAKAYERLPDAPKIGFSAQKISFLISLNEDGNPAGKPIDLRAFEGKKPVARLMVVPQPAKRASGIAPSFLWDKTSYVLGITAGDDKRLAKVHAAFKAYHLEALADTDDPGLAALRKFIENWEPGDFERLGWPEDMKDQNVVFALEGERLNGINMHDRPAAAALWAKVSSQVETTNAVCLVTGEPGPVARLHPAIKGVWGGQSAGASIVSFNASAYESYGHKQGDNAPVSEQAAFAYTTVLNRFLQKDSKNRIQIGDASTVFWADASDVGAAELAEQVHAAFFTDINEEMQATKVGDILEKLRQGMPLEDFAPELAEGVRFYVLGLAPNAARISIRFWLEDDFGRLAKNYQRFVSDMRIEPPPKNPNPALWHYLSELAVLGKRENVPPKLAGEWMRSILTKTPYPLTLFSTVLMRMRADKKVNALRVAILKAVLIRNFKQEVPVAFDPENENKGYLLGRLFALYEHVQTAALGRKVNATIKDKYYGAASAQPRKVFTLLDKGSANHLSKIGKIKPGYRVNLQKNIGAIMEKMAPADDPFPAFLSPEEQALFGLGYYHQNSENFKPKKTQDDTQEEPVT
ncbi:MAG: type I-C CRISPR-associated protein Cas8c/Csd1 [Alphaproteobacteria bacterium]|nr:type I-C CRISPR-associated protein Cas8c/Csd1 [Alphaproteobacteria bacterium]